MMRVVAGFLLAVVVGAGCWGCAKDGGGPETGVVRMTWKFDGKEGPFSPSDQARFFLDEKEVGVGPAGFDNLLGKLATEYPEGTTVLVYPCLPAGVERLGSGWRELPPWFSYPDGIDRFDDVAKCRKLKILASLDGSLATSGEY
jgi:hypothetical protein